MIFMLRCVDGAAAIAGAHTRMARSTLPPTVDSGDICGRFEKSEYKRTNGKKKQCEKRECAFVCAMPIV